MSHGWIVPCFEFDDYSFLSSHVKKSLEECSIFLSLVPLLWNLIGLVRWLWREVQSFFKPAHLELPEPEINAEKCSCIQFESPSVMQCTPL